MTASRGTRYPAADLRVLVVGLGSMGKRRVRNLQRLGARSIVGFDPREDRRAEAESRYAIGTTDDLDGALQSDVDVVIVSTPPDLHFVYGRTAALAGKHFFMEANVKADGLSELIDACKGRNIVAAPSQTMRFLPGVRTMKQVIDSGRVGRVLAFTHHFGHYLPDWHPWEDYRSFYAARRETGAGREIVPWELSWLTWILGPITGVSCFKAKVSGLDVDIDDVYQLLLRCRSGAIGHLQVDCLARTPVRSSRFIAEEGTIEWDWAGSSVRILDATTGRWEELVQGAGDPEPGYVHGEDPYVEELAHFLDAVLGAAAYPHTLEDEREVLRLLEMAERSAETGRHVSREDVDGERIGG